MNKQQVEGRVDQTTGKIKEAAGKMVGNEKLQTQGMAEQLKGKVKAAYGDTKEHAKDVAQKVVNKM